MMKPDKEMEEFIKEADDMCGGYIGAFSSGDVRLMNQYASYRDTNGERVSGEANPYFKGVVKQLNMSQNQAKNSARIMNGNTNFRAKMVRNSDGSYRFDNKSVNGTKQGLQYTKITTKKATPKNSRPFRESSGRVTRYQSNSQSLGTKTAKNIKNTPKRTYVRKNGNAVIKTPSKTTGNKGGSSSGRGSGRGTTRGSGRGTTRGTSNKIKKPGSGSPLRNKKTTRKFGNKGKKTSWKNRNKGRGRGRR